MRWPQEEPTLRITTSLAPAVLAGLLLTGPAPAGAKGTWAPQSDPAHMVVDWQTDDGRGAYYVVLDFTQPVTGAATSGGTPCQTAFEGDPRRIECPLADHGPPPASGQVQATLQANSGCADSLPMRVSFDGVSYATQNPIIAANDCSGQPGPDLTPAGSPLARPRFPILVGAGEGGGPRVRVFTPPSTMPSADFLAFGSGVQTSVSVAAGDISGDGIADIITAPGAGAAPNVKAFDGRTGALLRSFFAFDPSFQGGVFVAAGDVNGDGRADIITGAGSGSVPLVRVFDGVGGDTLRSFTAFAPSFQGGVRVAAGDVNGDGVDDIVVGSGPGGGPQVGVFDGSTGRRLPGTFGLDQRFTSGVFVAVGDVDGDGHADVITGSGAGGEPRVSVFGGATHRELSSFLALDPSLRGGVTVAAGDVNGDGRDDVIAGAGPGGGPQIRIFRGAGPDVLSSFAAFDQAFTGGVFVGGTSLDGASAGSGRLALAPSGRIPISLSCPATVSGGCRGVVTLLLGGSSPRRAVMGARRGAVVLGRARFRTPAGKHRRVTLRMRPAGRRAIGRRRRVRARLTIATRDHAGNARTTSRRVVVRVRRR